MVEAGARVAIGDIHAEMAAETAEQINLGAAGQESGGEALGLPLDVTDRDGFDLFLDQAEAKFGPIDCLVNNAGVMLLGPVDEEEPAATRAMIEVNLIGVINGTQAAMDRMKPRRRGRIINIASQDGRRGYLLRDQIRGYRILGGGPSRAERHRRIDLVGAAGLGQHRARDRPAGHPTDGPAFSRRDRRGGGGGAGRGR
jgi:NAD(P)-dependent dehydrogenase (short-subunit alcohol dehydrogenase family)